MEQIKWKTDEEVPAELAKYMRELMKKGYLTPDTGDTTFEVVSNIKDGSKAADKTKEPASESQKEDTIAPYASSEYIDEQTWRRTEREARRSHPVSFINGADATRTDRFHDSPYYDVYQGTPGLIDYSKELSSYYPDSIVMIEREQQTDMSYALMSPRQMQLVASSFLNGDKSESGFVGKDQLASCLKEAQIYPDESLTAELTKDIAGDKVPWSKYFFFCQSIYGPYKPPETNWKKA